MAQLVKAGLQIQRLGKDCYVGQLRLLHGKLEVHSDDGDMVVLSPESLRREMVDGITKILVPDERGVLHPVDPTWTQNESSKAKGHRSKIKSILAFFDVHLKAGTPIKEITPLVAAYCREEEYGKAPTERTLRHWREKDKGHESRLSPKWHLCGNRYQGPDELLLAIIKEVVDVAILGSDRFTLSAAWRIISANYDIHWRQSNGEASIPPAHSIRKLKNFLRAMPWLDLMKLRLDGRTARAITRVAVRVHTADILWECVEMDATVLNILVCDENGVEIGRPVLYVAVDVATGYPVGLHLTIQKPSTLPFVECLRFMFFPKPDDFDSRYGIKSRIEVFGKPILLRVDNGSEFVGITAEELVYQLFGDTARCKPYVPQEKPHVERLNGILKTYVLTLPGATTSSVTGAIRVIPKGEKLYQIEELRGVIYRFVYDNYCLRINELRSKLSQKAVAPFDIVNHMKSMFTEPVPVSREEFERSLCFKRESRRLGLDGISFRGGLYHSDELAKIYLTSGPGKYSFLYSELDASVILVSPPNGGDPVPAYEKHLEGLSIDHASAKALRKKLIEDGKELNRRTFAHEHQRFNAEKGIAKSSRGRAQQARINDKLNAAEEQVRRTMPKQQSQGPASTRSGAPNRVNTDGALTPPKGRKMGGRNE